MIKVSAMYPNAPDATFDMDYYCTTHLSMVEKLLGSALQGSSIDSGFAGGASDVAAPYIAMGHLLFETFENFQEAFGPNAEKINADVPNYTNATPHIQISEVKL